MSIFDFFKSIGERHERLKRKIHAFRIPLSPAGQKVMAVVYFSIPVICGVFIMDYAIGKSRSTVEKLEKRSEEGTRSSHIETKEQNAALQHFLKSLKDK
jgi:hypothetical protein